MVCAILKLEPAKWSRWWLPGEDGSWEFLTTYVSNSSDLEDIAKEAEKKYAELQEKNKQLRRKGANPNSLKGKGKQKDEKFWDAYFRMAGKSLKTPLKNGGFQPYKFTKEQKEFLQEMHRKNFPDEGGGGQGQGKGQRTLEKPSAGKAGQMDGKRANAEQGGGTEGKKAKTEKES